MDDSNRLSGRVALVTGGGRGIGRACALALAHAGADVAVLARSAAELEETAALAAGAPRAGPRVSALPCDVTDERQVTDAAARVRDELGPVTILVAAAGIARSGPFERITDEEWNAHLNVNVTGAFYLARAVIADMVAARWGRIVMIASVASKYPARYTAAYTTSKHALLGLTRSLALEYAAGGITANAVCPGYVDTAMTGNSIETISSKTGRTRDEARRILESASPQGRLYTVEEVAALVAYLCSPAAAGVNGQGIVLDGGAVMS